ncbi:MAG: YjbH domain-containing protein [Sulfuriferula sp.]
MSHAKYFGSIFVACLAMGVAPAHAERLSDWLLKQTQNPDYYPLGLSWQVPGEKAQQSELRFDLLQYLIDAGVSAKVDADSLTRMRHWVEKLPVTGRVPVAVADARWLQANPARDPIIAPQDTVVLPKRPQTVTVVMADGRLCRVVQSPKLLAMDDVLRCTPKVNVDWVYLAQPDGTVQRFGVANWNSEKQSPPAPGAWIWAPPRGSGWSESFSRKLIAFLATQGPAPDAATSEPASQTAGKLSLAPPIIANDWGEAGLLQTPSARMRKAGDVSFTVSRVYPYTRENLFLQPFDWFEVGFRYTDISNQLYGPVSLSGNQAYIDKSVDVKLGLFHETAYLPEVAVGIRDAAGTGLFSSEYIVANKRTGSVDWSLGMGWGYLGGRGDIPNPLGLINNTYKLRNGALSGTGNFSFSSYFSGPAALFGGAEYQTPWEPLSLKLEYDGNNYRNEPFSMQLPQRSPINAAVVYQVSKNLDITVGVERGNTAMLSVTLHSNLSTLNTPKLDDASPVAVRDTEPVQAPDWSVTARDIAQQTHWHVSKITVQGKTLRVTIEGAKSVYWRSDLDKAVAVLHREAPSGISRFEFIYRSHGARVAEHSVNRKAWVKKRTQASAPSQQTSDVVALSPEAKESSGSVLYVKSQPVFESHLGLNFNYLLGGPNSFLLYQVAPIEQATLRLDDNTWFQGGVQVDVLDNFNKFTYDAPSNLPRVRTDLREYMTTSKITMPNFQLTHVERLSSDQYVSIYGGYLEQMFGGVGAEWLYRPFASHLAIGVDVNEVQQRAFAENFGFLNYRVLTGHTTMYWDTGWKDVLATVSVGRYLAGDVGATVDVSRVFQNGVRMGAYFTKTNVSAQQFGEGSFDKGIYLKVPFDVILTKSGDTTGNLLYDPLVRDGGAKLDRQVVLYDLTNPRSDRALDYAPAPQPDDTTIPENLRNKWDPILVKPESQLHAVPQPTGKHWTVDAPHFENRMTEALYAQGFRNIKLAFDSAYRLNISLTNGSIHPESRAVGRAARTVLLNAPLDVREIRITYNEQIEYDFFDIPKLKSYFDGKISENELKPAVKIVFFNRSYHEQDPFACFADLSNGPSASLIENAVPDFHPIDRVKNDMVGAVHAASAVDWLSAGLEGASLVLGSSLLDKPADNFAQHYGSNRWMRVGENVGNSIPWLASAGTALTALFSHDPELSNTAYAGSESAITAFVMVEGLKSVVGRARPYTGLGSTNFHPFAGSARNGTDSFPSGHTIVAWAIVTPFAEEYNAPWLYSIAAVTNVGRVMGRRHWVSDTVAGSFLGYGIGTLFWESAKSQNPYSPHVMVSPTGVNFSWDF